MQQVSQRLRLAHLLILSSVLAGCGPAGPTKYPVRGQVTFRGEPIVKGTMTLIPDSPTGRTATAPIVDGKYSAELTEGSWTVNVQAVRETGPVIPALGEAPREQFIPAKYNRESTLKISVPSDEPDHNFMLEP